MRLLYLGDTASPHYRAWPSHFAALGLDVHSCHLARAAPGPPIAGVTTHPPGSGSTAGVRGAWLAGAPSVALLRRRLRPDVVHSHQVVPAGFLAELGRAEPHVATAWGSEVLLARGIGRRLVARVARGAELLTADSHHLLDVLRRSGASAERLRWVPWGVSASWAAPALELSREQAAGRAGLPADRPIVLSQRGPAPLYRQDTVVRAMAELAEDSPDALAVVPALDRSPGGEHTARLREQVRQLGLAGNVEIVEPWPHDEVAFAYRAAAVCVSVPESDSAPTSVFEALAVGTPAIVSELPWVSEPVHREARLAVVPVGDHAALAGAIAAALSGELDGGVEPNRELVARSFDRDTVFAGMEHEYERLSAGSGRGRAAGARA